MSPKTLLLRSDLSCFLNMTGTLETIVTRINFRRTVPDQIVFLLTSLALNDVVDNMDPIETVTKLKGNEPKTRVTKKGRRGRDKTPEMTYGELKIRNKRI